MRTVQKLAVAAAAVVFATAACSDRITQPGTTTGPHVVASEAAALCPNCVVDQTFVRNAAVPTEDTIIFADRPGTADSIDVSDLGSSGANATVLLNGVVVAGPDSIGGAASFHLRAAVSLLAKNTLIVRQTGKPGSVLRVQVIEVPLFPTWCGQFLTFDGAQLPAGWSTYIGRGGPGLVDDRLEGRPIDSGARVDAPTASGGSGLKKLIFDYDAHAAYSFWGIDHGISLQTSTDDWDFLDQTAEYNFGFNVFGFRMFQSDSLWFQASRSVEVARTLVPYVYGDQHFHLVVTGDSATWTARNLATNDSIVVAQAIPSAFSLSDVRRVAFHVYTTTNDLTWGDNLRITCE